MGIDITCGEKSFSCGYGHWNEIRTATIIATANYLKYIKTLNQFEERTYPYVSQEIINEFMSQLLSYGKDPEQKQEQVTEKKQEQKQEEVTEQNPEQNPEQEINLIGLFLGNCTLDLIDILIFFDVGGLFSFCNKSDCEGYYSVGNSYDICELFNIIKPFINNTDLPDNYLYNTITQVEEVFQESVKIKQKVLIC